MNTGHLAEARRQLTAPGAPFEVARTRVRGVDVLCFKNAANDLGEVWRATRAFEERTYCVYADERLSFADAHERVSSIANWLFAEGVRPGDRVAIAMRNYPEWMLIYWACVSTGIAAVAMNAWWTAEEMAYALNDSQPRVLFCDGERLQRVAEKPEMTEGVHVVAVRCDGGPGIIPWWQVESFGGPLPEVAIDTDSDASILYTSGTTGFPKGARLTHRGCIHNLQSMSYWARAQALASELETGAPPPAPTPGVLLLATPLFHVTANNCGAQIAAASGGTIVLMYRWDPGEALRLIERERVTNLSSVPTMARELISHPDFDRYDTSSLRTLGGGGAQLHPDLVGKIDARVRGRPSSGYGMTEVCGVIASIAGDLFVERPESVGPPMPSLEVQCVNEDGEPTRPGEVGELWVRGGAVIAGYLNQPEATAETITDGWLHTGDVARIDADGFIYLVDRKKEMVLRGGENVYCAEVQAALHRHPAVAECCVFGVPDDRLGEEVAAAVVPHPRHELTAGELRAHCAGLIARNKVPRYIWITPEPLPRNASGKFVKREIRAALAREAGLSHPA